MHSFSPSASIVKRRRRKKEQQHTNQQEKCRSVACFPVPSFFFLYIYTRSYGGGVVGTPRRRRRIRRTTHKITRRWREIPIVRDRMMKGRHKFLCQNVVVTMSNGSLFKWKWIKQILRNEKRQNSKWFPNQLYNKIKSNQIKNTGSSKIFEK